MLRVGLGLFRVEIVRGFLGQKKCFGVPPLPLPSPTPLGVFDGRREGGGGLSEEFN